MADLYPMKIDIFTHVVPPKYRDVVSKILPSGRWQVTLKLPTMWDLESRFRIMDKFGVTHVITVANPGVEEIADSEKAVELAKLANDEMAEWVYKYPDKFLAAIACLPMNNIDAALQEIDRTITDLHFKGVQIFTSINGKPLDSPEFAPLFEKMSQYNLPILMHPDRSLLHADYKDESQSKYGVWIIFGWPYETSVAMTRLVYSGLLEKYPNLKIITHHCGAMVPYFADRIVGLHNMYDARMRTNMGEPLTRPPIEYFKMFYNDTALYGNPNALTCGYQFFGADHILFGTDMPFDSQLGECHTRNTINAIEQMDISDFEKKLIFEDNARKLLHLPV